MLVCITGTAGEVVASDLYTLSNYDDLDSLTWHVVGDNVPWSFDRVLSQLRQGYCDYYESSLKLQRGVAALQKSLDAQGAAMLAGSADAVAQLHEQVVAMGETLNRMQAQYETAAAAAASDNVQAAESARCELQAAIGSARSAASAAQVAEALALTSLEHDLNVGSAETTASIGYSLQDQQSFWNQQKAQSDHQLGKVAGETSENVRKSSWEKGAAEYKKNLIDEIWKIKRDRILKYIQYGLDIASAVVCFIPGVGLALSVGLRAVSCVISIARGDTVGLAISLLPMGTIMKGAAKLVAPAGRLLFKGVAAGAKIVIPKAIQVAKGVLGAGARKGGGDALRDFYLRRAASRSFAVKLWIHNQLARVVGGRAVSAVEIINAITTRTAFQKKFLLCSKTTRRAGGYLIRGSTRGGYFAKETAEHELLHIGQYLRNPGVSEKFLPSLIHELIPAYIGSPAIYFGGTTIILGGLYWQVKGNQ